jgi:hypothetical protein
MECIYRNAFCCLVAGHGSSPEVGLFVEEVVSALRPGTTGVPTEVNGIIWRATHYSDEAISKAAVSKRGWCLQERYLSTRLLHFTKSGLVRECNGGIENGVTNLFLPPVHYPMGHSTQESSCQQPMATVPTAGIGAMIVRPWSECPHAIFSNSIK